ncbi:tetratricopeptide repeat protein [Phytohabitans kaempferiae]|uniref:Tetratricopeptide repeat protein n=1 Tax=Phytohabitans kaempferiae TaxID=1620943 RepID=A0ABV6MG00_9ACTN
MPSDAPSDRDATPDSYVQRAALLADLGRYDEAAGELADALTLEPGHPAAHAALASVHLAAERPAEALQAADAAVAAAPHDLPALVTRAMALTDLRRFGEAAQVAAEILRLGPADAYAQRSAAAILADSRNGQTSIDAAWRAVQLAPRDPLAHLVLALVAGRLGRFELAERAYHEALQLDSTLAGAADEPGIVRLDRRRYARALERVSESAVLPPVPAFQPAPVPAAKRPADRLRPMVLFGAGHSLVTAILVAFVEAAGGASSQLLAGVLGGVGLLAIGILVSRLPRGDRFGGRPGRLATIAVSAGPFLIVLYALIGTPWPLALAIAAAVAGLTLLTRMG